MNEGRAGCSPTDGLQGATVRAGRAELWRILRGTPLSLGQHQMLLKSAGSWSEFKHILFVVLTVYVPGGRYDYLTLSGKQHVDRLTSDWTVGNTLSHIQVARLTVLHQRHPQLKLN